MKSWTTPAQLAWLKEKIPDWHKARREKRKGGLWLEATTASFLDTFTSPKGDRAKVPAVGSLPFLLLQATTNVFPEN